MRTFNALEAKTHLSQLLERVERGEEIVIARAGTPVARLLPFAPEPARRVLVPILTADRQRAAYDVEILEADRRR